MNKKFVSSVITVLFAFAGASAQTLAGESVISANGGFSLLGALFKLSNIDENVDASAPPAIQLSYDYALTDHLSLGGGLSYQRFKLSYTDYGDNMENFDARLSRFNIAIRGLVHYGGQENLDMYSGLRLGLTNWSADVGTDDPNFKPPKTDGVTFGPQLILFGIRGYVAGNLGVNAELGVGGPHFFSLGLQYRL